MRALPVGHYFPPEVGASQVGPSTLARTWAADGDTVTVLTAMPDYPSDLVSPQWIEISADSHRIVVHDFRSAEADGKSLRRGRQDRSHRVQVAAFKSAVEGSAKVSTEAMLRTMRATIQAAETERAATLDHAIVSDQEKEGYS
jgi:hypothetical protein